MMKLPPTPRMKGYRVHTSPCSPLNLPLMGNVERIWLKKDSRMGDLEEIRGIKPLFISSHTTRSNTPSKETNDDHQSSQCQRTYG